MALNWQIHTINNYKDTCWIPVDPKDIEKQEYMHSTTFHDEKKNEAGVLNPVTNALIWATMTVGFWEITRKNWKEFYWRIQFYEKTRGAMLNAYKDGKPSEKYMTPKEIHDHIGLSTNAEQLTKLQFIKKVAKMDEQSCSYNIGEEDDE